MSPVRSLVTLARPRGAWLVAMLPLIGYGYALWERGSTISPWRALPTVVALAFAWLFGHAGAMWANARFDRDRGAVLLGQAVPAPRVTNLASALALIASCVLAAALGPIPFVCTTLCALLALLYSHPVIALKKRSLAGPLVNAVGYGLLSPIAGYACGRPILTWRAGLSLALFVLFISAAYFAAQAFQEDEDRARRYRTFVAVHGASRTLAVTHVLVRVATIAVVLLAASGVYPRAVLLGIPAWVAAEVHVRRWRRSTIHGGTERDAARLLRHLAIGATICVLGAYAEHAVHVVRGEPAGGRATAIVPASLAFRWGFERTFGARAAIRTPSSTVR